MGQARALACFVVLRTCKLQNQVVICVKPLCAGAASIGGAGVSECRLLY